MRVRAWHCRYDNCRLWRALVRRDHAELLSAAQALGVGACGGLTRGDALTRSDAGPEFAEWLPLMFTYRSMGSNATMGSHMSEVRVQCMRACAGLCAGLNSDSIQIILAAAARCAASLSSHARIAPSARTTAGTPRAATTALWNSVSTAR